MLYLGEYKLADNSFSKNGNTKWTAIVNQTSTMATYTIPTGGKYIDRDIELTITIPENDVATVQETLTYLGISLLDLTVEEF